MKSKNWFFLAAFVLELSKIYYITLITRNIFDPYIVPVLNLLFIPIIPLLMIGPVIYFLLFFNQIRFRPFIPLAMVQKVLSLGSIPLFAVKIAVADASLFYDLRLIIAIICLFYIVDFIFFIYLLLLQKSGQTVLPDFNESRVEED